MFDSEQAKKRVRNSIVLIGGFLFFTALLLLIAVLVFFCACWYKWVSPATLGQFGDFMGGTLNPLFSVASLFLIGTSLYFTLLSLELAMAANEFTMFSTQKQIESEIERHKQVLIANETKSRRDLTITWHQNWMSPQMSEFKRRVYADMQFLIFKSDASRSPAFLGELEISTNVEHRKVHQGFKDIMNLIQTTITFFENRLVDRELFLRLFENELKQWHSVLSRLNMRINTSDGSQYSETQDAERRDLVERLARVIGLQETSVAS
jgi:hypothetical protein